jgi:hypothetical protein
MSEPDSRQEVRRQRLLLAGTAVLAVVAPAVIWRIGRMDADRASVRQDPPPPGTPTEDQGEAAKSDAPATRAARAAARTAEAVGSSVPEPTNAPAAGKRKRRDSTPVADELPTALPRKRQRDPGTPTAQP